LFFIIFIPLITKQINYFSSIESEKVVQLIQGPIDWIQNLFKSFNKDFSEQTLKDYYCDLLNLIYNILFSQGSASVLRINSDVGS
jgi:hypothetical protein